MTRRSQLELDLEMPVRWVEHGKVPGERLRRERAYGIAGGRSFRRAILAW